MKTENESCHYVVSPLLLFLVVLFVSCLLMSNILANQMLQFWRWSIDAGTLTFPVTYILSNVFSEVYGYKWSRRVTWIAASMNLILAIFISLSIALPQPQWYDGSHFSTAIGGSFRIVVASLVSYVIGDLVNDKIFRGLKRDKIGLEGFKTRATLSSLGGQIIDTTLFVLIAFMFVMPASEMIPMIIISVFLKVGYEILVLPLTCKITRIVSKQEEKFMLDIMNRREQS